MGIAQEIQKRIRNKEAEILRLETERRELEMQIESAKSYIQGLRDILPKAEREDSGPSVGDFRAGSMPAQVKTILEEAGKPLHINDIVQKLGRENNKQNRLSVAGTLARCVREGIAFTRPAPNTFGLIGDGQDVREEELPPGFGQ